MTGCFLMTRPHARGEHLLGFLAATIAVLLAAGAAAQTSQNGGGDSAGPRSVAAGQRLFATACRSCHGEEGVGNRAPALRGDRFTADYVRRLIARGKPGTLMPTFASGLSAAQIEGLTRYVVSLQRPSELMALRGDPSAGREIFFNPGAADSCHVCHTLGGEGARVGPDLTKRLPGHGPRDIFQRIVIVPHRSADPAYPKVAITTRSGERFVGIRTESTDGDFAFYDTATLPPVLRRLPRGEVVSAEQLNGTAMPSDYASRFSLQQLLDLVAFLAPYGKAPARPITLADVVALSR